MARRKLSKVDQELWKKVKESATPLSQNRNLPVLTKTVVKKEVLTEYPITGMQNRPIASSMLMTLPLPPGKPILKMDKKTFAKMTRGRLEPEATLDLHGYTLAQAHPLLMHFIQRNFNANRRLLLVITGKGSKHRPLADERDGYGVLRKQVPVWLSSSLCKANILHVRQANVKHGGSGALYVYLARNKSKI